MNAHVEQVGGDHYQAQYQHWDWSAETGLGCLEYAATKYIARWGKKPGEGVEGLRKAITYLQKIKALGITFCPPAFMRPMRSQWRLEQFLTSSGLGGESRVIIAMIDGWSSHTDLDQAMRFLQNIVDAGGGNGS